MSTPIDPMQAARTLLRAQIVAAVGPGLADAVLDAAERGTPREWQECDAWLAGRVLADPAHVVAPMRRNGDSATRAGMLARGQWRGIPTPPRGALLDPPGGHHYTPGDGYALLRAELQAARDAAQRNAQAARDARAAKQERRAAHTARDGYQHTSGTYCAGYRPPRRK